MFLIRGSVQFEKCLPESISCIPATTRRMALRDALENNRDVTKFANEYKVELFNLVQKLSSGRIIYMREQPIFEWEVNGQPFFSSNWRFEQVMTLNVIKHGYYTEGLRLACEGDYKNAKKSFVDATKICEEIMHGPVAAWSFKDMITLKMSHEDFWECEMAYMNAYSLLMTTQFALQEEKHSLLQVISKKMYEAAALALHQDDRAKDIHDLALLTYAYSKASHLWKEGKHATALAMTRWKEVEKPRLDGSQKLMAYFTEQEELFVSWERENANVYFVSPDDKVPDLETITVTGP